MIQEEDHVIQGGGSLIHVRTSCSFTTASTYLPCTESP